MSTVPEIRRVSSRDELQTLFALSDERPVMILKHSTRCPASAAALRDFERYAQQAVARGVECAVVLVVEERDLSREIATELKVAHQSPQAILLRARQAVWSESHRGVTVAALRAAEGADASASLDSS